MPAHKKEVELAHALALLEKRYRIPASEIIILIKTKQQERLRLQQLQIPVSLFGKTPLSTLEAMTVYLHEHEGVSFSQMGEILGRHPASLHTSYAQAKKKYSHAISFASQNKFTVPCAIFKEKKYSVLECLVKYLKQEYVLKNIFIAKLLNKDPRTIWTVLQRAEKKGWSDE